MSQPTGKRLLIVDDHAQLRWILAGALQREGYVVRTAGDVESGRAAVDQGAIDVAVIDIELPDGSGWDLIRLARLKRGRLVQIIAISAGHSLRPPDAAAQPDGLLAKPFAIDALLAQIGHRSPPSSTLNESLAR